MLHDNMLPMPKEHREYMFYLNIIFLTYETFQFRIKKYLDAYMYVCLLTTALAIKVVTYNQ